MKTAEMDGPHPSGRFSPRSGDDDPLQTPPQTDGGSGRHLAAVTGAMLIWSTSFVATKLAYSSFPPLTLGAVRFVIASVILLIAAQWMELLVLPPRRDLGMMALSGLLGITLYFAMENIGVHLTTASNAALIMSSYPAITMIMERLIYGVHVTAMKWVGIALAMVGVMFVSGAGAGAGGEHALLGNVILCGTGVVWAFYNFATRSVVNRYPAVTVSLYQTLAGSLAFIPLALLERGQWREPTAASWGIAAYLGVFCSVAAFMLFNYGLRRLTAGAAVSLTNLVPVFGVFFSVIILGESVSVWQLAGGAVVLFGVYLSVRKQRAPQERKNDKSDSL